jgi:hypothetical protein
MGLDPEITRPLVDWNRYAADVDGYQETELMEPMGSVEGRSAASDQESKRRIARLYTGSTKSKRREIEEAKHRERERIYRESLTKNHRIRPAPDQKVIENIFFELPPEPKPYSAFLRSQGKARLQPSELRSFLTFIDIALSKTKNVIPIATSHLDRWRRKQGGTRHLTIGEYDFSTQDVGMQSTMMSNLPERNHYGNLATGIRDRFNERMHDTSSDYAAIYWMASVPANEGLGGTLDDVFRAQANPIAKLLEGTLVDVLKRLYHKDEEMFALPPVWDRFFAVGGFTIVSEVVIFRGTNLKDMVIEEFNYQIYDRYDWWHDSLKEESGKHVPFFATDDDLRKYPVIEQFATVHFKIPLTQYNLISIDSKLFMLIEEAGGGRWFDIITDIYHGDKTTLKTLALGELRR